jgi:RecJ-like exonuclease
MTNQINKCGCIYTFEEADCNHCQGSGEDYDMTGIGFCEYCSGSGYKKEWQIESYCDEHEGELDEYESF